MELLLFLLFGGILAINVGSDRSATKKAALSSSRRIEWHKQRIDKWRTLVADKALEEDLMNFIRDPRNYETVWSQVKDAYMQMPSCRTFTRLLLYPYMVEQVFGRDRYTKKQQERIADTNCQDVLDILLAKHGKVRFVNTCDGWHFKDLNPGEGEHSREVWDETFDFCIYIRDELRRHGVPARLIFKTGSINELEQNAYDADDVDEFRYKVGTLTWLPLTYFDDNLNHA